MSAITLDLNDIKIDPSIKPSRVWIRLPSGGKLDLLDPDPQSWTDMDLAIRLARTGRWSGESIGPDQLSVAQHSLFVLEMRRQFGSPMTPIEELREGLHDAEEGFLGFDCLSPLKKVLGSPFEKVSERLIAAVNVRYGLPDWDSASYKEHKNADLIAAAAEAVHCIGWTKKEVRETLGIAHPVIEYDPLTAVYPGEPWEIWSPNVAAERFLAAMNDLMLKINNEAGFRKQP